MLSPEDLAELEQRIREVVCSYCKERCPLTDCIYEQCSIRTYLPSPVIRTGRVEGEFDRRVRAALQILDREWNKPIRLRYLANRLGLSTSRLEHLFKSDTGTTLQKLIYERRLWYAAKLLTTTEMRVSEVCYYVGFKNQSNFNHAFRKKYGLTPRHFRRQYPGPIFEQDSAAKAVAAASSKE